MTPYINTYAFILLLQVDALQFKNFDILFGIRFFLFVLGFGFVFDITLKNDKNVWYFYNCVYCTIKCISDRKEIQFCHSINKKLILCFNLYIWQREKMVHGLASGSVFKSNLLHYRHPALGAKGTFISLLSLEPIPLHHHARAMRKWMLGIFWKPFPHQYDEQQLNHYTCWPTTCVFRHI